VKTWNFTSSACCFVFVNFLALESVLYTVRSIFWRFRKTAAKIDNYTSQALPPARPEGKEFLGNFTLGNFKKIWRYVSISLKIKNKGHFTLRLACTYVTSTLQVLLIDTGFVLAMYELRPNTHKSRVRSFVNINVYGTLAFVSWVRVCKTRKRPFKILTFSLFFLTFFKNLNLGTITGREF